MPKYIFDTNGILAQENMKRVLCFVDSVTFELNDLENEESRTLIGAQAGPVLRNAEYGPGTHWENR